jgi:hypothetical protein
MARLQPSMFPDIEGPDFVRSEAIADVAETVLTKHGRVGGAGRLFPVARAIRDEEIRVLWLRNDKPFDPEKDDLDHDAVGKCIKAPTLWHDVTGYDIAIWIRGYFWDRWEALLQEAVVLHELLHIEINRDKDDQVKLALRKHDLEAFADVARFYGPVEGEAQAYLRAAAVWDGDQVPTSIKSRTSRPKSAAADVPAAAPPADPDALVCEGSNHVPGCEHFPDQPPVAGPVH